ncbi:MAG: lipoate--protein ligase family protein [Gammaproteobacteria bacterium]|nr:lipoate--protein ligase family protein [Gammaproteobacteria bacterium]
MARMTDRPPLRVIDSGVLEGRLNIATGQAIIEAHRAGHVSDTLRFLRFPPTALVGRHQALAQEIDLDYCRANNVGVVRRITGGGAIYLDPGQLGWELAVSRRRLGGALEHVARTICEAAARGISALGVEARYRPRNDIEVDGRKISGTGGFFDGDTLFYQGTVLVDMDPGAMVSALRVPRSKLKRHDLDSAEHRIVTLRELLGESTPPLETIQAALLDAFCEGFGLAPLHDTLRSVERQEADALLEEEIGTEEFVAGIEEPPAARGDLAGVCHGPGGAIRVYLRLEGAAQNRLRGILITGDFFITPPRLIYDLESRLRGVYLDDLEATVRAFFEHAQAQALSVSPDDFIAAIDDALEAK